MAFKIITVPLPETLNRDMDVNAFLNAHTVVELVRGKVITREQLGKVPQVELTGSDHRFL